eukprot:gene8453-9319_t
MDLLQVLFSSLFLSSFYFLYPSVLTKPVVIWFLGGVAWSTGSGYGRWLGVGLALSSLGDIFLALEDYQGVDAFIPGLVSFLLAHVVYIAALRQPLASSSSSSPSSSSIAVAVAVYLLAVLANLVPAAEASLRLPIIVYASAIGAMAFFAVNRWARRGQGSAAGGGGEVVQESSAWLCLLGALSFVSSDTVLAFNKFYAPIPHAHLIVMVTYYLGQTLLASSALPLTLPLTANNRKEKEKKKD